MDCKFYLVAVLAAVGFVLGCGPPAEGVPMPVLVTQLDGGAFMVSVPVCEGADVIARFDLFWSSDSLSTRGVGSEAGRRVVELIVDDVTMRDGSFNAAEVRALTGPGPDGTDTAGSVTYVVVTTTRGLAAWHPRVVSEIGREVVVTGRGLTADQSADALERWC